MLFDLRSGARKRTIKVVYLGLALLMFVGFVGFGIGSSGLSGSIGDLLRDQNAGGENDPVERLQTQAANADRAAPSPTPAAVSEAEVVAADRQIWEAVKAENWDALAAMPPGESKHEEVRYLDIHEDDPLDEAQFAAWVKQASQLPGEKM